MKTIAKIGLGLLIIAGLGFYSYVISESGRLTGVEEGKEIGSEAGFKAGRVYQATVTPIFFVPKEKPVKEVLDSMSPYDIFDYLKERNEKERKREENAIGKVY